MFVEHSLDLHMHFGQYQIGHTKPMKSAGGTFDSTVVYLTGNSADF